MRHFVGFSVLLAASSTFALAAQPQTTLDVETASRVNPFKPAKGPAAAVAAANETIEFAGVSTLGTTTHLIFHNKTSKKSHWIKLNETVEGISVLRYDPRVEQAVVKVDGAEKTLPLRKGSGPTNSPPPAPVMPLPPVANFGMPTTAVQLPPNMPQPMPVPSSGTPEPAVAAAVADKIQTSNVPEGQVKAETEARMLVSDLLEIGIAQRKAYEDAQRRAAEGKTAPAPNASAPGAPPPPTPIP